MGLYGLEYASCSKLVEFRCGYKTVNINVVTQFVATQHVAIVLFR